MSRIITPAAIFAARIAVAKPRHKLGESFYANLDRSLNHLVVSEIPASDNDGRPVIAVTAEFVMKAPRQPVTLTIDVPAALSAQVIDGEPGPRADRRYVDTEVINAEHLWQFWPRCWLVNERTRIAQVAGDWYHVPIHGFLLAKGLTVTSEKDGEKQRQTVRKTGLQLHTDTAKPVAFKDAAALLAAGWKVRREPFSHYRRSSSPVEVPRTRHLNAAR